MQETKQKEIRVFVFVASINDVPFFSKLFTDHTEMKEFSAKHSGEHKSHDDKIYTSTYFDLTDKSFISTLLAERDAEVREFVEEDINCRIAKGDDLSTLTREINEMLEDIKENITNKLDGK